MPDITAVITALTDLEQAVSGLAATLADLRAQLAAVPPPVDLQPVLDKIAAIRALIPA